MESVMIRLIKVIQLATITVGLVVLIAYGVHAAFAFDHGFNKESPDTKWFESLMIPPHYVVSCCGKADAYPVDRYEKLPNGDYRVWIAKGHDKPYPDGTRRTPWNIDVPIVVPAARVNREEDDLDNPTEFSWLFFDPARTFDGSPSSKVVEIYCFIRHPQGT